LTGLGRKDRQKVVDLSDAMAASLRQIDIIASFRESIRPIPVVNEEPGPDLDIPEFCHGPFHGHSPEPKWGSIE